MIAGFALLLLAAVQPIAQDAQASGPKAPCLLGSGLLYALDDYPRESLRREEGGYVRMQLTVRPDGRVERCDVTVSSGFPTLDGASCAAAKRRGRFSPAFGLDGKPTHALFFTTTHWQMGKWFNMPKRTLAEHLVKLAPSVIVKGSVPTIDVAATVDAAGKLQVCTGYARNRKIPVPAAHLVKSACTSLTRTSFEPVRDEVGAAVPATIVSTIAFS